MSYKTTNTLDFWRKSLLGAPDSNTILGGTNNTIDNSCKGCVIATGVNCSFGAGVTNSMILFGNNITATESNTYYAAGADNVVRKIYDFDLAPWNISYIGAVGTGSGLTNTVIHSGTNNRIGNNLRQVVILSGNDVTAYCSYSFIGLNENGKSVACLC